MILRDGPNAMERQGVRGQEQSAKGRRGKASGKKCLLGQFWETGKVGRGEDSCSWVSGLETRGEDAVLLTSWGKGGW